jgi:hypothetical protein
VINVETIQATCSSVIGLFLFGLLFLMFVSAIVRRKLVIHGGVVRGGLARIIGVVVGSGYIAGFYLAITALLQAELSYSRLAGLWVGLFLLLVVGVWLTSIFWKPPK